VARTTSDAARARALAEESRRASLDITLSRTLQRSYAHAARALGARALLLEGQAEEAMRAHDALVMPWDDVRNEGDLGLRVAQMTQRALALEAQGRPEAQEAWLAIRGLAYPRLWSTDLWVLAGTHLEEAP
jgi:hypothetical protein